MQSRLNLSAFRGFACLCHMRLALTLPANCDLPKCGILHPGFCSQSPGDLWRLQLGGSDHSQSVLMKSRIMRTNDLHVDERLIYIILVALLVYAGMFFANKDTHTSAKVDLSEPLADDRGAR